MSETAMGAEWRRPCGAARDRRAVMVPDPDVPGLWWPTRELMAAGRACGRAGRPLAANPAPKCQPTHTDAQWRSQRREKGPPMSDRIGPPLVGHGHVTYRTTPKPCWLCGGLGGVALHLHWSEVRGKPLWTAHAPTSTVHEVRPCPVCTPGGPMVTAHKAAADRPRNTTSMERTQVVTIDARPVAAASAPAHWPVVTRLRTGGWGVHCLACSTAAGDYVASCLVSPDEEWPPPVLHEPVMNPGVEASRRKRAAARVSQPVSGPIDPGDGRGAAPATVDGSAGRTEPRVHYEVEMYNDGCRVMRGEDVPPEWIELASRGYSMHGAGLVANLLAAVIPAIEAATEQRVRAQVAAATLAKVQAELVKLRERYPYQDELSAQYRIGVADALATIDRIAREGR